MKHVKNAIVTFIKVYITSRFLAFIGSFGDNRFFDALASLNDGNNAFNAAAISSALTFVGSITSRGGKSITANFGSKFMQRQAIAPRQLVYGQCRVGGTIAHIETTGTDNFLLHIVCVISGNTIEEITYIRKNEINLTKHYVNNFFINKSRVLIPRNLFSSEKDLILIPI